MAHYVSGQLPFQLPRLRLRGGPEYYSAEPGAWLPMPEAPRTVTRPGFKRPLRSRTAPASRTATKQSPKAKKRRKGPLQHGDTKYCVFAGGKKKQQVSCHRTKAAAQKAAKRERIKRLNRKGKLSKGVGVRVKKMKHVLECGTGRKRVCATRKKGSSACKRWTCKKA